MKQKKTESNVQVQKSVYYYTGCCDDEFVRKLSINFLDRLDERYDDELFVLGAFTDVIRKLGFRNSWCSYFDLTVK